MSKLRCATLVLSVVLLIECSLADWQTLWRDDFDGPSGKFPNQWKADIGTGWGNNQVEYDTQDPRNVGLDGKGRLKITPRLDNGKWTSARIETLRDDFRPPKGGKMAIEGRIKIPAVTGDAALGYWPAFWSLGSPIRQGVQWPHGGEIDFLENVNGIDRVYGTLHCGKNQGGPCNEPLGLGKNVPCPGRACTDGFHVYRFEWDETKNPIELRWYIDGQQYHKITKDQLPQRTWDNMTNHKGYFLILNVAMGGVFPDGVANKKTSTATTQPNHPMIVDYVAVFTSNN